VIHHVWTVLCTRAVIDRDTNNVTLQNVIEQLNVQGEPRPGARLNGSYVIMTLWSRADMDVPCTGFVRLTYLSPSGVALDAFETQVDLSGITRRTRTRVSFQGLPVEEGGLYTFRVELWDDPEGAWHQVATVPLEVVFISPETGQRQSKP